MMSLDASITCLKAVGISMMQFDLNGSGDSGDLEVGEITTVSGAQLRAIPSLTIDFDTHGVSTLAQLLDRIIADLPEGDWVNNEGGQGTVTLFPQAPDPDGRCEIDMTYNDEDYDGDDDFEDEEGEGPGIRDVEDEETEGVQDPSADADGSGTRSLTSGDAEKTDEAQDILITIKPDKTTGGQGFSL